MMREKKQGSIIIRLQQPTSLRRASRALVIAKHFVLCDGLRFSGGHQNAHELSDWRHWSAADMRGRDAGGLL